MIRRDEPRLALWLIRFVRHLVPEEAPGAVAEAIRDVLDRTDRPAPAGVRSVATGRDGRG